MKVNVKNGKSYLTNGAFNQHLDEETIQINEFPRKDKFIKLNKSNSCVELLTGETIITSEKFDFLDDEIIVSRDYFDGRGFHYDFKLKKLTKKGDFSILEFFPSKSIEGFNLFYNDCISFILEVMLNENPYVYNLFTQVNNKLSKFSPEWYAKNKYNLLNNLFNSIENLNNLEKISKSLGVDFIYSNLKNEDFELSNEKKLNKVISLPMVVANGISKLKIEASYDDFKEIAKNDTNNSVVLIEYLLDFRKLMKAKYSDRETLSLFVKNLAYLMEFKIYSENFYDLLNFLVNENFNYNELSLPHSEAKELYDYYSIAQTMMEADKSLKLEKFPKNIQKHLNIIQQNNVILSNPRPEEFKNATSKYSFVEDSTDENYVFLYPKDEMELLEEGNLLHHCVANYRDRIIDKGTIVVFMRKKGEENTPFVTIEYENGLATQMKEKFNEDVIDMDIIDSISKWSTRAKRRENKGGKNV